ncbi:retinol dehydrogenase 12 [Microdochium nivale]|nr:retinol dehydrogenase 12 [Microdochium nivale]
MTRILALAARPGATADRVRDNESFYLYIVSSAGHSLAPPGGIAFDTLKTTGATIGTGARYGQSKLANALYAKALARHYPQLTAVSLHPGVVKTNLAATFKASGVLATALVSAISAVVGMDVAAGTLNQLWASTAKDVVSGTYYDPIGVTGRGKPPIDDEALAERLWEWTEKELEGQTVE